MSYEKRPKEKIKKTTELLKLVRLLRLTSQVSGIIVSSDHYIYKTEVSCSTDEKKLYQELERLSRQFLESCLASESLDASRYQLLTELAANKNISMGEAQYKISALLQKWDHLKDLTTRLDDSCPRINSTRKLKKLVKERLTPIACCTELITEIVDNFWDYLSDDVRESLKEATGLLLRLDAEDYVEQAEAKLCNCGKLSDIAQKRYRFYKSILRLRKSLQVRLVDQPVEEESDWYEAKTMKRFLDFLVDDALSDRSKLVPYTEEMSARARDLIAGVYIDDD